MFSDGSRIYFSEPLFGGAARLMQVSTEGGEAVPVEIPFESGGISDISPNRTELLIGGPPKGNGLLENEKRLIWREINRLLTD
jgi:hypothetical protein